jgi:WD40 repeat protein
MTFAGPTHGRAWCLWLLALTLIGYSVGNGVLARDPDPPVLTEAATIEQQGLHVYALAFTPDGKRLAVAAMSEAVQVFDVATRERVLRIGQPGRNFDESVRELAVAPDGKTIAFGETVRAPGDNIAYDGRARLAELTTGKLLKAADFDPPTQALAYTPDGKSLAVGLMSGEVHLLDATTLDRRRVFRDPDQDSKTRRRDVAHIAFNPDGSRLAVAFLSMRGPHQPPPDPDTEIHVWDVAAGKLVHRLLSRGAGGAHSVAFAPRGIVLAAGYSDGKVRLWDAATGKLSATYGDDAPGVRAVAFSPDGRRLVAGGYKPALRVWEVDTGKLLFKHDESEGLSEVTSLAFSPDGKLLATGGSRYKVVLWKVAPAGKAD